MAVNEDKVKLTWKRDRQFPQSHWNERHNVVMLWKIFVFLLSLRAAVSLGICCAAFLEHGVRCSSLLCWLQAEGVGSSKPQLQTHSSPIPPNNRAGHGFVLHHSTLQMLPSRRITSSQEGKKKKNKRSGSLITHLNLCLGLPPSWLTAQ